MISFCSFCVKALLRCAISLIYDPEEREIGALASGDWQAVIIKSKTKTQRLVIGLFID
jgi:hypothetical protein